MVGNIARCLGDEEANAGRAGADRTRVRKRRAGLRVRPPAMGERRGSRARPGAGAGRRGPDHPDPGTGRPARLPRVRRSPQKISVPAAVVIVPTGCSLLYMLARSRRRRHDTDLTVHDRDEPTSPMPSTVAPGRSPAHPYTSWPGTPGLSAASPGSAETSLFADTEGH